MPKQATAAPDPRAAARKKLIGAVRAACSRLGIADADRRAAQEELIGKASMSDMSAAELGRLLDHFNRGWSGSSTARPHVAKVRALWWTLYWLGAVDEPADHAIDAFVKRQTGIAALRFLDHVHAAPVIEALKSWAAREGVKWRCEISARPILHIHPGVTLAQFDRHSVLSAIESKLRKRKLIYGNYVDYCTRALGLNLNHWTWSDRQGDEAIRLLGKQLRRAIETEKAHAG